jgi:hypothetical protein
VIQFVFDCAVPVRGFRRRELPREFLAVRDKGMFTTDSNAFIFLPLVRYAGPGAIPIFSGPEWLSIFDESSAEQNIAAKLAFVMAALVATVELPIADVLLTIVSSQFVVPMLFNLYIGVYSRGGGQKEMKGTFLKKSPRQLI